MADSFLTGGNISSQTTVGGSGSGRLGTFSANTFQAQAFDSNFGSGEAQGSMVPEAYYTGGSISTLAVLVGTLGADAVFSGLQIFGATTMLGTFVAEALFTGGNVTGLTSVTGSITTEGVAIISRGGAGHGWHDDEYTPPEYVETRERRRSFYMVTTNMLGDIHTQAFSVVKGLDINFFAEVGEVTVYNPTIVFVDRLDRLPAPEVAATADPFMWPSLEDEVEINLDSMEMTTGPSIAVESTGDIKKSTLTGVTATLKRVA